MGYNFRPVERDQQYLLPPSIRDWLPEDHLAWFVLDAFGELSEAELAPLYARHRADGWGAAAFEPTMMAALLVYAYATGERSSRRIEARCRTDIAYRVITANQFPDHATIARFRANQAAALERLFGAVLVLCARAGMGRLGLIALDGTRIAAATTVRANRTAAELEAEIRAILAEAAAVDAAEDEDHGPDRRGDEPPAGLATRTGRLERLREAHRQLEAEAAERRQDAEAREARRAEAAAKGRRPPGRPRTRERRPPQRNPTDPDSRPLKVPTGWLQGYNAQAAVSEDGLIVAADLAADGVDAHHLEPLVGQLRANIARAGFREPLGDLVADAGYWNPVHIARVEASGGPRVLVPPWQPRGNHDRWRPPPPARAEMLRRLGEPDGAARYARRSTIVEPVFGEIKEARRFRRFSRRGLAACRSEWLLVCTSYNLRKLWRRTGNPRPLLAAV